MPVSYRFHTLPICNILSDDSIDIPAHQRPEIWDVNRKIELIDTIMRGLPILPLVLYEELIDGKRIRWLEDGQQRYLSASGFKGDKFKARTSSGEYKLYSELNAEEKAKFNYYNMPVMTYENASEEERLHVFQYMQNGVSLKSGQRFHAMQSISPIVRYAKETFMMGNNERVSKVFGFGNKPVKDTKTKKTLENAMAIAGGLVLGTGFITTSYDIIGPQLLKNIPPTAEIALNVLLEIYESVQTKSAWCNKELKRYQWPVGKITGYVLWSILHCMCFDGNIEALTEGWVSFLLHVRANRNLLKILYKNKPSSRNWTSQRWRTGFENIFTGGPTAAVFNDNILSEDISEVNESLDDDDDDT